MSSLALTLSDSSTMFRRSLVHLRRYPSLTLMLIGLPVVLLLLFVFVFGETMGAGLGAAAGAADGSAGRAAYLAYVTPALLAMAAASAAQGTAISVATDMTEGIVARFRTMSIARSAVLTGHVLGSLVQALLCIATLLGIAVLVGYRPAASPLQWLGVLGVSVLISLALIWLSVALGMQARTVETASNTPMFLTLLPFLGSGFVPVESMPSAMAWFAEYQPFTPVIETLRALLSGQAADSSDVLLTVLWCLGLSVLGWWWSVRLYERRTLRG
jgi:ABC-2 type transport system permease protein